MPLASAATNRDAPFGAGRAGALQEQRSGQKPFLGLIDTAIVDDGGNFEFDGSVAGAHATSIWTWMCRDIAPDLLPSPADDNATMTAEMLESVLPEVLRRVRDKVAAETTKGLPDPRFKTQLGGDEAWNRLPVVLNAIKCRHLLEKAASFGRATNSIADDAAMATALQSMPLQDSAVAAVLMHAAVGQVINPSRLLTAAIRAVGGAAEATLIRGGFGPLVDAMLAHAQNQLPALQPQGAFADTDLVCRALDRFHRLMRSINGYVELARSSRWSTIVAGLTKSVSQRIEPKLREVSADVNSSMRKSMQAVDRLDSDRLLAALNGVYLLVTVRDCRDSLGVNAVFDQTWTQTGQALEMHLTRNLDQYRANPADRIAAERLETGIKMAELRFNAEYAEVLRRAMDAAGRRGAGG